MRMLVALKSTIVDVDPRSVVTVWVRPLLSSNPSLERVIPLLLTERPHDS